MIPLFLIIFVIWTYFQGFFSQYFSFVYTNIDLIDEYILIVLSICWVGRILLRRAKFKKTPFDVIILIIFSYIIIVSVINLRNPLISLLAIRDSFQYLLFFFLVVQLEIGKGVLDYLFKLIYKIAIIQFFVLAGQFILYYYKTRNFYLEDFANGTFGDHASHKLGYFMGMMIITSLIFFLETRKKKYLYSSILFILSLILTSCRGAFFFTFIVLIFLFKDKIFRNIRNFFILFFILISMISLIYFYTTISTGRIGMIHPFTLIDQQFGINPGAARRIGVLIYSFSLLSDSDQLMIGFSPGTMGKTSRYFPVREKLIIEDPIISRQEGPVVLNQASITFLEYGIIGGLLIFIVYLKIYNIDKFILKKKKYYLQNLALIFKGVFFIYFLGVFAEAVFEIQEISFYFWFLFSMLYMAEKKNKNIHK